MLCLNGVLVGIRQHLIKAPAYLREVLPDLVQNVDLSRPAINNVLKKHKLNGYPKKKEGWKSLSVLKYPMNYGN